jgi:hypothetical protein
MADFEIRPDHLTDIETALFVCLSPSISELPDLVNLRFTHAFNSGGGWAKLAMSSHV